jgi:hypothetical protein
LLWIDGGLGWVWIGLDWVGFEFCLDWVSVARFWLGSGLSSVSVWNGLGCSVWVARFRLLGCSVSVGRFVSGEEFATNSKVDRSVATALPAAPHSNFSKQWSRETRDSRGRKKSQNLKSRARDYDHTHETA